MDELLNFVKNTYHINRTIMYVEIPEASEQSLDMQEGLDSWIGDADKALVDNFIAAKSQEGSH